MTGRVPAVTGHAKVVGFCLLFLFLMVTVSCGGDSTEASDKAKVTCQAGCSTMSWGIEGQSGSVNINETCTRNYTGNSYVETCTGSRTYSSTGKTFSYTAVFDWPSCKITVNVTNVGSCSDS